MTVLAVQIPVDSNVFTSDSACTVVVMDPDTILNFLNLIVNFIFGLASAVAALLSIRAFYETRKGQASTFHGKIRVTSTIL